MLTFISSQFFEAIDISFCSTANRKLTEILKEENSITFSKQRKIMNVRKCELPRSFLKTNFKCSANFFLP